MGLAWAGLKEGRPIARAVGELFEVARYRCPALAGVGGEEELAAERAAQGATEIPLPQGAGRRGIEDSRKVLAFEKEAKGTDLVDAVDPRDPLPAAPDRTADEEPERHYHRRQCAPSVPQDESRARDDPSDAEGFDLPRGLLPAFHDVREESGPGRGRLAEFFVAARPVVAHGGRLDDHSGLGACGGDRFGHGLGGDAGGEHAHQELEAAGELDGAAPRRTVTATVCFDTL